MGTNDALLVIALTDYDPSEDDHQDNEETIQTAPDVEVQLSFQCCDRFEVIGNEVSWWLYVKCHRSNQHGYIPSIMVAPLKQHLTSQE